MTYTHESVLLSEAVEALCIKENGIYVDGTLGRGGHTRRIAEKLKGGRLIAIDRDTDAIDAVKPLVQGLPVSLVHDNFSNMAAILDAMGIARVDGVLLDLGLSSPQLDEALRGFSYMKDAPLDMRMDKSQSRSARDIVNDCSLEELKRILYDYGEERYAPRIAAAMVRFRETAPIETTAQLTQIIRSAMPGSALREDQHPAKRSFQAIRIAVNDELGSLEQVIEDMIPRLNPAGRFAIITFHSLEDRIVKSAFRRAEKPCTCPDDFPVCVCGRKPLVRLADRKPILPGEEEIKRNPRARSAKLRIAERV